jgi:hypothetical protein
MPTSSPTNQADVSPHGQGLQRHRNRARPADLDDAIDAAAIGQLARLLVPIGRLAVNATRAVTAAQGNVAASSKEGWLNRLIAPRVETTVALAHRKTTHVSLKENL